jgi:spore maturation protein CgeB
MSHPEERRRIAEAGRKRVLQDHTYHNRVQQILDIYYKI